MSPVPAAEGAREPIAGEALAPASGLGSLAVLIPAWQPDERLVALVRALMDAGFGRAIVVNDGSRAECAAIFGEIGALERVDVLHHAVNLGKGRALKTGFNHVLSGNGAAPVGALSGVVTADADGQHTREDIERVGEALFRSGQHPVLGVRTFAGDVPLRSRLGNLLTRRLFSFLTGTRIADTQTGLRGLPVTVLPALMTLDGERYEYEMTMLAHLCRSGPTPLQVPIATVYLENNRGSHFDPVWDSMRIYFVLLRYYASSLLAAGLDLLLFTICFALTGAVLSSVVVGRLSSLVNFWVNRRLVFHSGSSVRQTLWRYYALVVAIGAASYWSIVGLHRYAHWPVLLAKVCVDVLLSVMSFAVQRTFVFQRGDAL